MYSHSKVTLIRNIAIAFFNGLITLIILLIAPLGMTAVISNTFLVTVASFFVATFADTVINFMLSGYRSRPDFPLDTEGKFEQLRQQIDQIDHLKK